MNKDYQLLFDSVEQIKDKILEAERYIWTHPEVGYREWNTHRYMKEHFISLGYEVHEAGDIPGFYADVDTEREGPTLGISLMRPPLPMRGDDRTCRDPQS